MTEYRRRKNSDTWHWCTNCSNWPTRDYVTWRGEGRPPHGELDNNCKSLEKHRDCIKK